MEQKNKREEKKLGRGIKSMRELVRQLDSTLDGASISQSKAVEILRQNKLMLSESQLFLSRLDTF